MSRIIKNETNPKAIENIVTHTAWNHKDTTLFWLKIIEEGASDLSDSMPFLHLFQHMVHITDILEDWRIDELATLLTRKLIKGKHKDILKKVLATCRTCMDESSKFKKKIAKSKSYILQADAGFDFK